MWIRVTFRHNPDLKNKMLQATGEQRSAELLSSWLHWKFMYLSIWHLKDAVPKTVCLLASMQHSALEREVITLNSEILISWLSDPAVESTAERITIVSHCVDLDCHFLYILNIPFFLLNEHVCCIYVWTHVDLLQFVFVRNRLELESLETLN